MGLTTAQLQSREGRLTASRVACLMTGDEAEIMSLWRELVGDPTFIPKDLSGIWPIQLGVATEALNLAWYERKTEHPLTRVGEVVLHPKADWAAATLDAWDDLLPGPVEAKHVGGREPTAVVIDRYHPQLTWQMLVTGAQQAAISIIEGANEPLIEVVPFDADYAAELWARAETFMACVWSLTPPIAQAAVTAPVKAERIVDMTGNNEFATHAVTWRENIAGKKAADAAEKALKALVPADAARCHGYGVVVSRDRANRLSLREMK